MAYQKSQSVFGLPTHPVSKSQIHCAEMNSNQWLRILHFKWILNMTCSCLSIVQKLFKTPIHPESQLEIVMLSWEKNNHLEGISILHSDLATLFNSMKSSKFITLSWGRQSVVGSFTRWWQRNNNVITYTLLIKNPPKTRKDFCFHKSKRMFTYQELKQIHWEVVETSKRGDEIVLQW